MVGNNPAYRYEVVYRSPGGDHKDALLPVYATVTKRSKRPNDVDGQSPNKFEFGALEDESNCGLEEDSGEHAYYNFPPRHPRHGHLRWPVLRPDSAAAIREDGVCR